MADWRGVVEAVAPMIGTALGGPMAGTAVKFLADKLLGKPTATQQDVGNFIAGASPDQLAALKKLDNDFAVQMKQLDVDLEKLSAGDRDSARNLAIKTNLWPQITISVIFVSAFLVISWRAFSGATLDPAMKDIVVYLMGILSAGVTQVLNFFLGSSAGSKHKDAGVMGLLNK